MFTISTEDGRRVAERDTLRAASQFVLWAVSRHGPLVVTDPVGNIMGRGRFIPDPVTGDGSDGQVDLP